ncbi:uncharacterized protein HaLaN_28107 [Haematococcus lacustris]|uniref:Calx-beta domain-containing protein n=1 Tax=Haematococcus lacustris TaxID=44745 RepID=A0A6A0AA59_HAELA|nr:uncharacterized protein HaLaN_28107 [Haematococcus lacustris]
MSYDALHKLVIESLPECDLEVSGACWTSPPSNDGGGLFLYSDDREACQGSWILLQGRFHGSVEVITSRTHKVKKRDLKTGGQKSSAANASKGICQHHVVLACTTAEEYSEEVPVWNWVVANITLMALGTSAPEIMLATVEAVLTLGQKPGELGPSCIVGSASYNFFAITAVCHLSLRPGQFKKIQQYRVFVTTAIWSVWSNVWMLLVYQVISPGEIEPWEAWLTLGQFPVLVLTAYIMDKQPWKSNQVSGTDGVRHINVASENKQALGPSLMQESPSSGRRRSVLHYRMLALRSMAGETKAVDMLRALETPHEVEMMFSSPNIGGSIAPSSHCKIGFGSLHYSVLEAQGAARVTVQRYDGDLSQPCRIQYCTKDGTAVSGLDYEPIAGVLYFKAGQTELELVIKIVDDDMSEPDVTFSVELQQIAGEATCIVQPLVQVTIVDDDDSGVLSFELPSLEAGMKDDYVDVPVIRRNGTDGQVSVEYSTRDGTAVAGQQYEDVVGNLDFASGQSKACIRVPLTHGAVTTCVFKLVLANPMGGAVLGRRTECRVIILPGSKLAPTTPVRQAVRGAGSETAQRATDSASQRTLQNMGAGSEEAFDLRLAWLQQLKEAVLPELDEGGNIWTEVLLHYVSITWKVVLAIIPPAKWWHGGPCFISAVALLIGVVALLKEFAELWGCAVGLSSLMTGLSLVAAGTSLPDTLASRMAAMHDDTADAAIGNITASNSVNVLLGLGLPWGTPYLVSSGPLGFSLIIFCSTCGAGLIAMAIRRRQGGELGAKTRLGQWMVALIVGTCSSWCLRACMTTTTSSPPCDTGEDVRACEAACLLLLPSFRTHQGAGGPSHSLHMYVAATTQAFCLRRNPCSPASHHVLDASCPPRAPCHRPILELLSSMATFADGQCVKLTCH